ncbi:MAG: secretion protein HlyD family [Clostridiales bacterium]|jgi:HlyD family secretion protein|nr:secretion protein HlyD family [Clostridiales bacterium]
MKKLGFYFLLLAALSLVVTGCAQSLADEAAGDKKGIVIQGTIEAKEVDINTKIPGRIEELLVSEGDEVKAGDVLFRISSEELLAKKAQAEALVQAAQGQLAAAQAAKKAAMAQLNKAENGAREEIIAQAKAALDLMEKTYARVKDLHDRGAISDQKKDEAAAQLEITRQKYKMALKGAREEDKSAAQAMVVQANAMVSAARGKLEQARAGLEEVEAYLKDTELKAPINGTITAVNVDEGELVSTGMPVLTITDLSKPWIEVHVKETDLDQVSLGQKVNVKLLSANQTYQGKVVRINKKPDFATKRATNENGDFDIVSFGVRVEIENAGLNLRPGMTAVVSFLN